MPPTESCRMTDLSDSEQDDPGTTEKPTAKARGRPKGKAKTSPMTPKKKAQNQVVPKTPSKSQASDAKTGSPAKTEPRTPLKRPAFSLKIMKKPSSVAAKQASDAEKPEAKDGKGQPQTCRAGDHGVGRALYVESNGLSYFNMRYPKTGKVSIRIKETKKNRVQCSWRLSDLNITAILWAHRDNWISFNLVDQGFCGRGISPAKWRHLHQGSGGYQGKWQCSQFCWAGHALDCGAAWADQWVQQCWAGRCSVPGWGCRVKRSWHWVPQIRASANSVIGSSSKECC